MLIVIAKMIIDETIQPMNFAGSYVHRMTAIEVCKNVLHLYPVHTCIL